MNSYLFGSRLDRKLAELAAELAHIWVNSACALECW